MNNIQRAALNSDLSSYTGTWGGIRATTVADAVSWANPSYTTGADTPTGPNPLGYRAGVGNGNGPVTITLGIEDQTSGDLENCVIKYRLNGGAITDYTGPFVADQFAQLQLGLGYLETMVDDGALYCQVECTGTPTVTYFCAVTLYYPAL